MLHKTLFKKKLILIFNLADAVISEGFLPGQYFVPFMLGKLHQRLSSHTIEESMSCYTRALRVLQSDRLKEGSMKSVQKLKQLVLYHIHSLRATFVLKLLGYSDKVDELRVEPSMGGSELPEFTREEVDSYIRGCEHRLNVVLECTAHQGVGLKGSPSLIGYSLVESNGSSALIALVHQYDVHIRSLQQLRDLQHFLNEQSERTLRMERPSTHESLYLAPVELIKSRVRQLIPSGSVDKEVFNKCLELEDRLCAVLLDAIAGLRSCQRKDQHEVRATCRIAKVLCALSNAVTNATSSQELLVLHSNPPTWLINSILSLFKIVDVQSNAEEQYGFLTKPLQSAVEPSLSELFLKLATNEMQKIFDKKRPQVVGLWRVQVASNNVEMVIPD